MMRQTKFFIAALGVFALSAQAADAPVVNVNGSELAANAASNQAAPTLSQRVQVLENQMQNLLQAGYANQISELQQSVDNLNGQISQLQNQLLQLQSSETAKIAGLETQIAQVKMAAVKPSSPPPVTTAPAVVKAAPTPTAAPLQGVSAEQAYAASFALVSQRNYPAAITSLQNFVALFPNSKFTGDAYFWLGEVYFRQGQVKLAQQQFEIVGKKFAKSPKAADAMWKLGEVYINQGEQSQAKLIFNQLVKAYPHTTAARLAKRKLAGM